MQRFKCAFFAFEFLSEENEPNMEKEKEIPVILQRVLFPVNNWQGMMGSERGYTNTPDFILSSTLCSLNIH